ncbi:MAG: hypothetical protein QOF58_4510 [Pseudonocardiales bacterium]|jgi:HAD superfamily hydrolase (TIGR01509 family)|nr:hypothetical protein [Pseudonocardiales bacterium]
MSDTLALRAEHWLPAARPRAILFDAGLTLIHPSGRILVEELERHGVAPGQVSPEQAVSALVMAAEARHLRLPSRLNGNEKVAVTWATLLGLDAGEATAGFMAATAREDLYRDIDAGALDTVRGLRERGILLGAVSNSEGTLREDLAVFGLLEHFDVVLDSTVVGIEKPEPGIFQLALDELGLRGEECWYVGDGLVNDVLGSQRAGFGAGILYDPFRCFGHLPAVARIEALTDLIRLVAD